MSGYSTTMLLRHRPNRIMRNVFVACAAGAIGLLLAGCSVFGLGHTDPHLYDSVDAVVAELDLESIGEIVHQSHYGTGEFSSSAVSIEVIVELETSTQALEQAIDDAGFEKRSRRSWERSSGESLILIRFVVIEAGDVITTADGTDIKGASETAAIAVSSFE